MSDWIPLDKACERIGHDYRFLSNILGRGRVQVIAKRDDRPCGEPPNYVESLLAEVAAFDPFGVQILGDRIAVWRGQRFPVRLSEVRVHWPQLATELEVAGGRMRRVRTRQTKPSGKRDVAIAAVRRPQRGPKPGNTGFNAADNALCPTIDDMVKRGEARSAIAAARILAEKGRVASGGGTVDSRANRLARRYGKWKSAAVSSKD
jgi:hypothetical protein